MIRVCLLFFVTMSAAGQFAEPVFDVQGHRGARGLMPENTIPAFIAALDTGVTTLEMDLAITRDGLVVVSHEPWMNPLICRPPQGINFSNGKDFSLYKMTYEEIKKWDCGSKTHPNFPGQKNQPAIKPLLRDVIAAVEDHIKSKTRYEVDYNLEIKSAPEGDGIFHPDPTAFSDLVVKMVDEYLPLERILIQSFDFRVLKYLHERYPQVRLAALTDSKKPLNDLLAELGFVPDVWSPNYRQLKREDVKKLHQLKPDSRPTKKVRVIPWTVNETNEMLSLKGMGIDGLITDYPDRAYQFRNTLKIKSR
ncbi:MAG: glycerophosphodiester phosphodiesterase [Bacteroidetes bacterium]|nr:glycerophosphodiester phosphodiesterase [Bacteroidota bacterium]